DAVGPDTEVLEAEECPGSPDAGLNLVEDEQGAELVGERAGRLQELRRGRVDAAFALNRFEDDRARIGTRCADERLDVVQLREGDAGDQGLERRPLRGLTGGRERSERS